MTSTKLNKLQLLCGHFINAQSQSSKKSLWLDLFLSEFLSQIHNGVNTHDIQNFCSMNGSSEGSIASLLACELSSDINDLCATKNEADQPIELYKYLMEGRGWRLLAVLNLLGVQGLSCGHKLIALLMALYPVPYHKSLEKYNSSDNQNTANELTNSTTPFQNPYLKLNLNNNILDTVNLVHQIKKKHNHKKLKDTYSVVNKINNQCSRKKSKKYYTNGFNNRVARVMKHSRSSKDKLESDAELSTESDIITDDTNQTCSSILKIHHNPMDFDYFTSIVRTDKDSNEHNSCHYRNPCSLDHENLESFIDDHMKKVLNSRVNHFEISLMILNLIQNMKNHDSLAEQALAVKVLKFSLDTLWSLQFNAETMHLSTNQCITLKTTTGRLMLISLEQVLKADETITAVIHNGLIPMTLKLLEDICSKPLTRCSLEEGSLLQEYVFAMIYSIIVFLNYLLHQRKTSDKIREFLQIFQLVIESQDGKLIQKAIGIIVDSPNNDLARSMTWIKKIIHVVGVLINGFKCMRLEDINKIKMNRLQRIYHHNSLFGCTYSQPLVSDVSPQVCYISSLFKILLTLLEQSTKFKWEVQVRLVKIMIHAGTCCCFPPQILLTSVVNFMKNHQNNKKIYAVCVTLLERCLFEEFCIFSCDYKAEDCNVCSKLSYSWEFLEIYKTLLSPDNLQLCYITMAHLFKVIPNSNLHVKNEMLFRVFYPTFLQMKNINKQASNYSNVEFIIQTCLSMISSLIVNSHMYEKFIEINGLQEVIPLFSTSTFTKSICNLLQVSVITEIWKIIKVDQYDDFGEFNLLAGSTIKIFFDIIEQETNNLCSIIENIKKSDIITAFNTSYKDSNINESLKNFQIKTESKELDIAINYDKLLLKNLFQASSIWRAAAVVSLYCPKFRTKLLHNLITDKALNLIITLSVFIIQDRIIDKNKHANKLIEALITCCLTWQKSDYDVITMVRDVLINTGIQLGRGITALVEVLLRVAMLKPCQEQTALQPNRPRIPNIMSDTSSPDYGDDDSSTGEYVTADDGYEADIENQSKNVEENLSKNINNVTPMIEIHSNVTADPALCTLAIDLLIHFSEQSLNDDRCGIVTQGLKKIATTCRESIYTCANLAGSGVISKLLNGFETILIHKDPKYKDLQYAILEVFTLLAMQSISSEELLFYFSLFKADSPPLLALLQSLYRLIANLKPQPNYILSFPVPSSLKIYSNIEKGGYEIMEKASSVVYNFKKKHLNLGICSPWSIHALYLPIGSELSWSVWLHGCSISMWIRVERGNLLTSRGTYLNSPINLFNTESDSCSDWGLLSDNWSRDVCAGSLSPPSPATIVHFISIGFESLVLETWLDLHSDKIIFRLSRPDDKTNRTISEASISGILPSGHWHHLALNIKDTILNRKSAVVEVIIWIDGWRQASVHLPFDGLLMRKPGNTCIMLGQIGPSSNGAWYLGNLMLFRCPVFTKERALYMTSLGPNYTNLADCILNPIKSDFASLIASGALSGVKQVKLEKGKFDLHRRKSYGGTYLRQVIETKIINSDINWESLMDDSNSQLGELQDNILLSYEAKCPEIANLYPQAITSPNAVVRNILPGQSGFRVISIPEHRISQQPPLSITIKTPDHIECQQYRGFISSASLIGGVPIFLYLFARVVELNSTEEEQARALSIVINLIRSDSELMTQYKLEGGHALLMRIIETPRCHAGKQVLKAILDCACDNSIIVNDVSNDTYTILQNCEAVVIDPELIKEALSAWRTWIKFETFNIFLQALFTLLRDQHEQREFNATQLNRVGIVETILLICKEHFMYEDSGVPWDGTTANIIIELIRSLMGAPPEFSHLVAIMDYLLLVHQASDTYVTHSRHNMYFLLPSLAEEDKNTADMINKTQFLNISNGTSSSDESIGVCEINKSNKAFINKQHQKDRSKKKRDKCYNNNHSNNSTNENDDTLENSAGEDSGIAASDGSNSKMKNDNYLSSSDEKRVCQGLVTGGLFILLRDALRVLPDCQVESVIKYVIRAELLLVMANNPDTRVRAAVIKVLQTFIQRATDEEVNKFIKHKYFYHLANQITIYPGSESLASTLEALEASRNSTLAAIPPLLAILTKTSLTGTNTVRQIVVFLTDIINKNPNNLKVLFEQGIIESVAQALALGAHKNNSTSLFNDIYILLVTIATKLLEIPGNNQIPMVLDLHSILSYIELHEKFQCGTNANCTSAVRIAQVILFDSELDVVMSKISSQTGFKLRSTASYFASTSHLTNVLMTSSEQSDHESHSSSYSNLYGFKEYGKGEINQRFRIILFKAIEFITAFDYISSNNELELTRKLFIILLYGLSSEFDKKSNWSSSWSSRPTFRKNAAKMMIWMLSPHQNVNIRIFVIRSLMEEPRGKEILSSLLETDCHIEKKLSILLWDLLGRKNDMPSADARICMEFKEALNIWQLIKGIDNVIPEMWNQELTSLRHEFTKNGEIFIKNNLSVIHRIENRFNGLVKQLTESAMMITRTVIEEQNRERKALMEKLKYTRGLQAQTMARWKDIIRRLTHERGPWYFSKSYPQNWELDPTEGPARVRIKMQRCHLNIDNKFFMPEYQNMNNIENIESPLSYLFKTVKQDVNASALIERLHTTESIHKMSQVKVVTPQAELPGEALIGETCLYFIPDNPEISLYTQDISLGGLDFAIAGGMAWKLQDIRELHKRRYQLKETAIEFFLTTGRTYLLAFNSSKDRDDFASQLLHCNLPHRIPGDDLGEALVAWRNGTLTNWEYITCLNKLAGRSYNDLMQYPVFPFVLADYISNKIDLNNHKIYRNFERPMAVQDKKNEQHYINNYNYLKQDLADGINRVALNQEPFHYGSHYSNSGTVLHFLVRLPPFTSMFLNYQDNNFDIPDRTFHSLATTWRLTSCDSTTDVKELIPEFFYLPEFLLNSGGFNFGLRQNGSRVGDVELPSWCKGDARLFILVHRAALEADYVRENLSYWIDLVFGFRQTGKPAIEAINVFHPATYYGFNVDQIADPLERDAWETMVKTYGQTPAQLFTTSHPLPIVNAINPITYNNIPQVIENVNGIKWGNYVGAPGNEPVLCWKHKHRVPMASLIPLITGDVFGLPIYTALLIGYNNEKGSNMLNNTSVLGAALVSWNNNDSIIRLKLKKEQPPKPLIKSSGLDPITVIASAPDCGQLWFGHHSGKIIVYEYNIKSTGKIDFKLTPASVLLAHRSTITIIVLSRAFSIVVSGDNKGIIVIWDLNSLLYVRSIVCDPIYSIHSISISNTLGDIAVACQVASITSQNNENNADHQSQLKVFTINTKIVGSVLSRRKITALCYSNAPEGASVNVIATGLDNGVIRLWSSWDLRLIREIVNGGKDCGAIISITWSQDQHHLYAATDESIVLIWEGIRRLSNDTPKFVNLTTL
ncbi:lysosomal-trafficking regulator [Chelonus insularis]|uniref:lysosomal-trafficking regulator n=1 Tax=Chelonus insularis TaxID=460826 RepID=UPI00158A8895|nr:lysosomal-trafficking regulator [Chelonus insularis]XP_034950426.1 lysosomal-trafficking regulator [Chelonus insularis]XP_034950427.1 lysosomal-trafficking regulator [Chelonus insularis]XP_034950428.1 lysosomal-trafficking regulator [Chelonus insularis]XP_034950429.1 lysosomal-trafficking regulator [Chelonus insularis]